MPPASKNDTARKGSAAVGNASNIARLRQSAKKPVDLSDIPEVTLRGQGQSHRLPKKSLTIRLDADIVAYYRRTGPGYQTRINLALRSAIHRPRSIRGQLHRTAVQLQTIAGTPRQ